MTFSKLMVIDFETTGLSPKTNQPIEVGVLKKEYISFQEFEKTYSTLIKLPKEGVIPKFITNLTGLTTKEVNKDGVKRDVIRKKLLSMIDDDTLVIAHNANFDLGFLYYHFDIKPKQFLCTRTVEFLTHPHESSSLEATYIRYFGETKQEHRALSDVYMTMEVLEKQIEIHGRNMDYFLNKVVITPERNLVYIPYNATVLDFSVQFQLKS